MEWPTVDLRSSGYDGPLTSEDEAYLEFITSAVITKQIYARAAKAAVTNILVDHQSSGIKADVEAFLEHLQTSDDDNWNSDYRSIAREFTELMASVQPRSRTLEICRAGLDAIHDLLKYRVPKGKGSGTILAAKDAFVLCQTFDKLETHSVTGSRAPDIDFRFGLWTKTLKPDEFADAHEFTLYGKDACSSVTELRDNGQMETSAASLASYTVMNPNLVTKLAKKIFVVIGCDHPMSPTQSLLQIPGVTVLGIPSSSSGLEQVLQYATYNNPDDTSFVYPMVSKQERGKDDENLILSRGPHVAQWILEQTKDAFHECQNSNLDSEIVLVPMPLPIIPGKPREMAVRWEASSDLILQRVLRARSDSMKCSIWSYQSPTTCMVVPSESTTKSTELLQNRPSHERLIHDLSRGTLLTPVVDEKIVRSPPTENESTNKPIYPNASHDYSIVNGILELEGPHHVLAEHIRMWRAMVTNFPDEYNRYGDDSDSDDDDDYDESNSSKNIHVFAPYVPLLSSSLFASKDARILDPLRVFEAGSASSLLCAIALAGVIDPIINRPMPVFEDGAIGASTPFAMFWNGSVHGGVWNCPYTLNSASGTTGYLLGKVYEYYHHYSSSFASKEEDPSNSENADSSGKSHESIVDAVPSSTNDDEELPRVVQERFEMMANA